KCLSYGMNDYVSKPIREKELYKIINDLLKGKTEMAESKNELNNRSGQNTEVLNLKYLRELSGGNTAFEVNMIEQFLQQVPGEIAKMDNEFINKNYATVRQIAHNMKTSVSFMGLIEKLGPHLDFIESNVNIQKENTYVQEKIMVVNKICQQAFEEAKQYLNRLH
ncbi:MAG TPA: hypothetical protein VK616_11365, partial [Flavitalea sp.]|nr:hypothetical protein [Flavitalea sp.]